MSANVRWGTFSDFFSSTRQKMREVPSIVAILASCRYVLCKKWGKNLQGPRIAPIFAVRKRTKVLTKKIYHYDRNRILRHDYPRFHRTETRNHVHGASLRIDDYWVFNNLYFEGVTSQDAAPSLYHVLVIFFKHELSRINVNFSESVYMLPNLQNTNSCKIHDNSC